MIVVGEALPNFRSFHLCCNKRLWEATNLTAWDEEYAYTLGGLKEGRLRCIGDLFDVQSMAADRNVCDANALSDWNAGLDGLGMLLGIATSPVQHFGDITLERRQNKQIQ
jgi:hypothetical protein